MMICSECGNKTELREISIAFERKGVRATMSGIPAMVCPNCGEEYVPSGIASTVVDAVSKTIDGTVDMFKQARVLRQQLVPESKTVLRERLELALA
jgi:YgiT-type zinc finger domain-containing protein